MTEEYQRIAAKICHDLAGSIGSALNGFEIADDMPEMRDEGLNTTRDQLNKAAASLRLFRYVFAGNTPPPLSAAEAGSMLSPNTVLSYNVPAPEGATARALLSSLRAASERLPRGGTIKVTADNQSYLITIAGQPVLREPEPEEDTESMRNFWHRTAKELIRAAGVKITTVTE